MPPRPSWLRRPRRAPKHWNEKYPRLALLFLSPFVVALFLVSVAGFYFESTLESRGKSTTAEVVDVLVDQGRGFEASYYRVRYTTADGEEVIAETFPGDGGSASPGDRIDIVYDPTDPYNSLKTGTSEANYAEPAFFLAVAMASLVFVYLSCGRWLLDD